MSFLTLKINSTDRNSIIEDFVYSNSLNGNPVIDINPSDVDNSLFAISNEVGIYDGATNLLTGEIKDLTSVILNGIETKASRIHIRDLKEKIFSADLTSYTGMTNLQALTYICSEAGVTLSTSVTTTKKYAMDKKIKSKSFWKYVQEICTSEGWSCYVNNNTLIVKDVLNDSSSYTLSLSTAYQIEHEYNDLNVYGNICLKGVINKDRLVSDDNPYSSILQYGSLSSLDTYSITGTSKGDFYSILQADTDVENFILNEDESFSFNLINATDIDDTFDYNTFTITSSSANLDILSVDKVLFDSGDTIAEQCSAAIFTCKVKKEGAVSFIADLIGKKITSSTADLTPDTFTAIYHDNDATTISKNRYLYYENRNITSVGQMTDILSSLARETCKRVLKVNVKIKTDHVFNLLDRLFIEDLNGNFDGYWSVYGFTCRRNVRQQEWLLTLVRSNTIIIPELNIYSKNNIPMLTGGFVNGTFKAIALIENDRDTSDNLELHSLKEVKCFIPQLDITVYATNENNFKISRGMNLFVKKIDQNNNWRIVSIDANTILSNPYKIHRYYADTDVINDYNGGFNTTLESVWETGFPSSPSTELYNETSGTMSAVSVSSVNIVDDVYNITITMDKEIDPATLNKNSFILF